MPHYAIVLLAALCVVALVTHALDYPAYLAAQQRVAHGLLLVGWATLTLRFGAMAMQFGDASITWAGGIGVGLLAAGMTMRLVVMGRRR